MNGNDEDKPQSIGINNTKCPNVSDSSSNIDNIIRDDNNWYDKTKIFDYVNVHNKYNVVRLDLIDQQIQYLTKRCEFLEGKNDILVDYIKREESKENKIEFDSDSTDTDTDSDHDITTKYGDDGGSNDNNVSQQDDKIQEKNRQEQYVNDELDNLIENSLVIANRIYNHKQYTEVDESEKNKEKESVEEEIFNTAILFPISINNQDKNNTKANQNENNNRNRPPPPPRRSGSKRIRSNLSDDDKLLDVLQNIINPPSFKTKKSTEISQNIKIADNDSRHDNLEYVELDCSFEKLEDLLQLYEFMDSIKNEHLANEQNIFTFEDGEYRDYYLFHDKKYGVNFAKLENIRTSLLKLINIVGMSELKAKMLDIIASRLCPGYVDPEPLHTLIMGNPGLGKTKVCKIIVSIYCGLGLSDKNRVVYAKRSQLVGKHLGHTAPQTQSMIDSAIGGILIIDEAYALGDEDSKDTFSKECINTIVQNMSENKKKFIIIMIGYENSIKQNLFNSNPGLESRFTTDTRFTINDYNASELAEIYWNNILKHNFVLSDATEQQVKNLLKENFNLFPGFGRSVKDYFNNCKKVHFKSLLGKNPVKSRYMLSFKTLQTCMKTFKSVNENNDKIFQSIYQ